MCGFQFYSANDIPLEVLEREFIKIKYRGPDMTRIIYDNNGFMGFHRLSIMDLSDNGMQPFVNNGIRVVCNGELYGFKEQKKEFAGQYNFTSSSDCELLIPLYLKYGVEMFNKLDAEFVCVIQDIDKGLVLAARDPIGIRPMFYGYSKVSGAIMFASEAKAIDKLCSDIYPFPVGSYYLNGEFVQYDDIAKRDINYSDDINTVISKINKYLTEGIVKRLDADAPVGYLLSGGLDSSLVCSIAAKYLNKPIRTFAIGMEGDAIDLKYAQIVADYIGSEHTSVIITKDDVMNALSDVIYSLETYDITTIRASIGMYLICHYIRKNTDIKVLLTGEISDELFGYKYTDFAPNAEEFQLESEKRLREIYMYDVLRADRSISSASIEARVPFGDLAFAKYVLSINPELKMNSYNMGKYLLRKAFEGDYLPQSILYREKAAFSDAVGHSLADHIKFNAELKYTEKDVEEAKIKYPENTPFTKESLLYRDIFESFFPNRSHLIADFWMPNRSWEGCNVNDPSARVLSNYGKSAV